MALCVDVGDAIGGKEDYDLIEYRYLLRAFADMKFDALNLGHREARLSATQLMGIRSNAPAPMLSANLRAKLGGHALFDAYRVVERGGFRIAIIGVVDPRGIGEELGEGLVIEPMETALARVLPEVRPKADLIVLLAFTDEETMAALARQFYELHVILGGKVSQPAQELRRENRSLIHFVTNESRALGVMKLRLREGSPLRVLNEEIRLLHDRIPQDPSFRELVQVYRDEVRRTRLAVDDPAARGDDLIPGVRAGPSYVGSQRCVECHKTAGAAWAKSGHAHAFATLVERRADADPQCVGCHTIGFESVSGYRREFGAQKLVDVGCESCHGPGSLHVRRREGDTGVEFVFRPLDAGDCKRCHYGEFSRPFDWATFWPVIQHGKEPAQTAVIP